jgi:hypothetical protein
MSGLPLDLMAKVLEDVSLLVLQGFSLVPGQVLEGALARVPVVVDELSAEGREATVGWSRWFHRRDVPAYQLVWPDAAGDFHWNAPEQPAAWRLPVERADLEWTLGATPGQPVHVCTHVAEDGEPVMRVVRDHDEQWQLLCDLDHSAETRAVMWPLSHCVKTAPSLLATDLKPGMTAWRDAPWLPWEHGRL